MDNRERYVAGLGVQIAANVNRIDTLEAEVERLRGALATIAALGDPTWDWCESGGGHAICDQAKAFACAALEPSP